MAVTKLSNSGIATGGVLKYDSMLAGNAAYDPGSFESIATVTVGSGGASTIDFTSIPQTYTHLQLQGILRATDGNDMPYVRINNSSSSGDYVWHNLVGNGASVSVGNSIGQGDTYFRLRNMPTSTSTANSFGAFVMDILDYTNTNKNTTIRTLGGNDNNGASPNGFVGISSAVYLPTTAVTRITFLTSANYAEYSTFALFGIKGI